jgi:hypothetical protein
MSSKISALPAATFMANIDLLTIVQTGVNYKITRDLVLLGTGIDDMFLAVANGAGVYVDGVGEVALTVLAGHAFTIGDTAAATYFEVSIHGAVTIEALAGQTIDISCNGCQIALLAAGGINIFPNAGQHVVIGYEVVTSGVWATSSPADFETAIARLAVAVRGLLGVPIP